MCSDTAGKRNSSSCGDIANDASGNASVVDGVAANSTVSVDAGGAVSAEDEESQEKKAKGVVVAYSPTQIETVMRSSSVPSSPRGNFQGLPQ